MKELRRNKPLATAAAKAGMSERTARRWRQRGMLPSEAVKPRSWRTREDPLADVWLEVEAMLELEGLEAKLIFEQLQRQYPERFRAGRIWNTCASCTWRPRRWRRRWKLSCSGSWRPGSEAIRAVLESARPAAAEALAMLPLQPQLSAYDELLAPAQEAG